VDREYLILSSLNAYNESLDQHERTEYGVPVPIAYCLCTDKKVVGSAFYVMEFIKGRIFQDIRMKDVNEEERRAW